MENNIDDKIINLYEKSKYFKIYGLDFWIVVVFIVLTIFLTAYIYILNHFKEVKQNWKNERCNPLYMPFAGMITSEDGKPNMEYTSENFKFCNNKFIKKAEKEAMNPLYFMTDTINNIFDELKNAWLVIAGTINLLKNKLGQLFQIIVERLIAVLIPIQNIFIKIKDIISKMTGSLVASIYTFYNLYKVIKLYLLNIIQITTTEVLITTILALVGAIALLVALLITYFVLSALGLIFPLFTWPLTVAAQALFWSTIVPLIISIGIMLVFDILIWICLTLLNNFANEVYKDINTKPIPKTKTKIKSSELKTTSDKSMNPLKG
jgi:hypothetical protein